MDENPNWSQYFAMKTEAARWTAFQKGIHFTESITAIML